MGTHTTRYETRDGKTRKVNPPGPAKAGKQGLPEGKPGVKPESPDVKPGEGKNSPPSGTAKEGA
jgi:hypothetical protein